MDFIDHIIFRFAIGFTSGLRGYSERRAHRAKTAVLGCFGPVQRRGSIFFMIGFHPRPGQQREVKDLWIGVSGSDP